MFNKTCRKKMYKAGKTWVIGAIFTITLAGVSLVSSSQAFADNGTQGTTPVVHQPETPTKAPVTATPSQAETGQSAEKQTPTNSTTDHQAEQPAADQTATEQASQASDATKVAGENSQPASDSDSEPKQSVTTEPQPTEPKQSQSEQPQTNQAGNSVASPSQTDADKSDKHEQKQPLEPANADQTTAEQPGAATHHDEASVSDQGQPKTNPETNSDDSAATEDETENDQPQPKQAPEKPGQYLDKNGDFYYQYNDGSYATGMTKISGITQYFDANGKQVKGGYVTIDGHKYYFKPGSGNAATGIQAVDDHNVAFNRKGEQVQNSFYEADKQKALPNLDALAQEPDENEADQVNDDNNPYQPRQKPKDKNKIAGNIYYVNQNGEIVTGLQTINGKTYYFDHSGIMRRGFSGVFNGELLYFDAKTGIATETKNSKIKEGITDQTTSYTAHNAVNGTSKDNFKNIDGYLTAESWYRPKEILANGKDWRASTATDYRPILMTWWPNKKTEVNYLNYMVKAGLIDNRQGFTLNDDQKLLNESVTAVQKAIEAKIGQKNDTEWLRELMRDFIKEQPQWNIISENPNHDHLQRGALSFINSKLTPDANSNFRLMNRTPTNQTGKEKYDVDKSKGGFELLLADDVDNSNPVVQAEQLNWLHFLMHFGAITNNDPDANFDGIRIDAVDNVDADLLNIAAKYFASLYGVKKSDQNALKHLSILEDWSHNDPLYMRDHGQGQLSMDDYSHTQLIWSLTKPDRLRGAMKRFLEYKMVDRSRDNQDNHALPNYSFVRAHDSEVQTVIAQIIEDLYPNVKNSLAPTQAQLEAAFKVYNEDMKQAVKKYTHYNMPSAYALMLTNKDTIPRVYYGDLYTDDGPFMGTKSPYFDAIDNFLKTRIKYVAGGQTMDVDQNDILTSVRFGKGAMNASDQGTTETRTEGIGVIISNNHNLKLKQSDQVVLHMGAAHRNQAFRAVTLTNADGLQSYSSDAQAPVRWTDENGDLIFTGNDIKGYLNPQVSGYLAAWVPVGAAADQDARTQASSQPNADGNTFHSNAASDSQVIFEGFSNFQAMPKTVDEFTNVRIAKNAQMFRDWGVTSMQLAPQYRSSDDNTFVDSIVKNGYAFSDRYDLGFNKPTKYGTATQLRDVIKALHAQGIQVMADFVPDQLYNMKKEELTTVNRTDSLGKQNTDSNMQGTLYVSNTRGGGAYQEKFGGEFLAQLQKDYPELFKDKQISTGQPIDPSTKIKEWSAKYFNGSNIEGKGQDFVLKDPATGHYFKVVDNGNDNGYLPKQLLNLPASAGFGRDQQGIVYFDTSGYQAKDAIIQDDQGNYYYFDASGHLVTGEQTINGSKYYFLPNGTELRSSFFQGQDGNTYYYTGSGRQARNQYVLDKGGNAYYFGDDGKMLVDKLYSVEGKYTQYFDQNGVEAKDRFVKTPDGKVHYFDDGSGNLVANRYAGDHDGNWYYIDDKGDATTGIMVLDGQKKYFHDNGIQSKGEFIDLGGNRFFYTDAADGHLVSGYQVINGHPHFFDPQTLIQVKGDFATNPATGKTYYFDANNGEPVKDQFITKTGQTYYLNAAGEKVFGSQVINGKTVNFDPQTGALLENGNDQSNVNHSANNAEEQPAAQANGQQAQPDQPQAEVQAKDAPVVKQ
ncbi:KxYKxGKxW signal peptide domain-containing protein [Fructilactobacillus myrtifloralis]|uniref:dextransucrase n=1 Tax=Fructilactobacillus myrtifloralis TaxID=2940301 RepID=A0ABY5BPC8_9LACO|nr:glycoside hydrolase family 70 protein [Fructilactobacillus myrtifloralis]USS85339.1 KxYKxGKxW signal peptide domain-containing protein [Fructilactobacillus myrtifloralis]